jgi:hypothetical protein
MSNRGNTNLFCLPILLIINKEDNRKPPEILTIRGSQESWPWWPTELNSTESGVYEENSKPFLLV